MSLCQLYPLPEKNLARSAGRVRGLAVCGGILLASVAVITTLPIGVADELPDGVTKVPLFTPGADGYPTFRMEALAVSTKGTILAFTEGRKGGSGVHGDVDLMLRRSFDGGKTWGPVQIAIDNGPNTVCYPTPLVDRETGKIWLAMCMYQAPAHQGTIARGDPPDTCHTWISHSNDDGASWAEPIEITEHVKPEGTTWHAPGAGFGIQMSNGRLVFPCYHFKAGPENKFRDHQSSVFYSDDHGKSWKLGGIVDRYAAETEVDPSISVEQRIKLNKGWFIPGRTDEAQVVELVDGRLLMNMRSYHCSYRRAISYSDDGGLNWSPVTLDEQLFEPICSGSIARLTSTRDGHQKNRIIFVNPNGRQPSGHRFVREKLTIRLSYDEGKTWPISKVLDPGPAGNLNAIGLPDGRIAVLYEGGTNDYFRETIYFATCTLDWLTDGRDHGEEQHSRALDDESQQRLAQIEHFEKRVGPLLLERCSECHGAEAQESGLRLDTIAGILAGGELGPLFIPGEPDKSALVAAVRRQGDLKMPPDEPLDRREIDVLVNWVRSGAPTPDGNFSLAFRPSSNVDAEFTAEEKSHWAFQPLQDPRPPKTQEESCVSSAIDQFVLAELEARGLRPSWPADRRTLIRRATLDLLGLPPTPAQIDRCLTDASPDAFSRLVDRLLADPRYGERWGRHWLDVVRYADSTGGDEDYAYAHAFRYRDYVIAAWNNDVPFDQFVCEQIAGDLMADPADPATTARRWIATGFLALGPKSLDEIDAGKQESDVIDEQVTLIGRGLLGLTMDCARCHDHKFDPIPTSDYYGLAGIFKSTRTMANYYGGGYNMAMWHEASIAGGKANVVADGDAHDMRIYIRGSHESLGDVVPRRFPRILVGNQQPPVGSVDSGRLELARWLTQPDTATGGLTSRVMVNRIWQHHFGRPIVGTPDNFGRLGEQPTHPDLLEWLARRFIDQQWSTKQMHRLIMNSSTYRQSSNPDCVLHIADSPNPQSPISNPQSKDPGNLWYGRYPRWRLEAEAIRDSILAVSGTLDLAMGGSLLSIGNRQAVTDTKSFEPALKYDFNRRSVYLPVARNSTYKLFEVFDFVDPKVVSGRRATTTVAPQALFFLNSPFALDASAAMADNLLQQDGLDDAGRVRLAYELTCARPADEEELRDALDYVRGYGLALADQTGDPQERRRRAWQSVCQTLLASNHFVYVD